METRNLLKIVFLQFILISICGSYPDADPASSGSISGSGNVVAPYTVSSTSQPIMHINRGAARQMYGSGQLRPPGQTPVVQQLSNMSTNIGIGSASNSGTAHGKVQKQDYQVKSFQRHDMQPAIWIGPNMPIYPRYHPADTLPRTQSRNRGGLYDVNILGRRGLNRQPPINIFRPGHPGLLYPEIHGNRYSGFPIARISSKSDHVGLYDPSEFDHSCDTACNENQHLCKRSCVCIDIANRCNGEPDCQDDEDELGCGDGIGPNHLSCEESENHIRCPNGGPCISKDFLCDGDDDCGDYSDETHCGFSKNCTSDQFECNNGLCIPHTWLCDNDNDCKDLSDELNCTKTGCSNDMFLCGDGVCISINWKCDKDSDCSDGSDEIDCDIDPPSCIEGEFQCANQKCSRLEFRCDGDDDCGDWSDEDNCLLSSPGSCGSGEFRCNNDHCIPESWRCDNVQDCEEGEDEAHCNKTITRTCSPDEYTCKSGSCILKTWVCDGSQDCPTGEDEINCKVVCDKSKFTCPAPNNETGSLDFCINKKHVCDGQRDCPRGEDEKDCPSKKDCDKDTNCTQLCITTADGKDACACRVGYDLDTDGITCNDINECLYETDPVCSQTCNNTVGSFICGCMTGYILRPDLRTCKALGAPPTLIFANRVDIRQVSLSNAKYTFIMKGLHNAIALDYHYEKGLIYWSDMTTDVIRRANINGTGATDVIKWGLESPGGIALDWIHDLLFWTDSGTRRVEVATLDGKQRVVVAASDLDKPRAIAVHPGEAIVFWTDWGPSPKIEKADMDGSNRKSVITESVFWPNGLTIDYTNNKIYWADAKHNVIESATLDGHERKKIISKGLPHPFAITLFEDAIFWTDWHTKSISTANKATGAGLRTVHSGLHFPMDIHSFHSQRQPSYKNRCSTNNGGCSHLCLPNSKSYTCVCPMGQKLKNDGKTCQKPEKLLLIARKKDLRIRQFDKKSSSLEMVIPVDGVKSAVALAWDSNTDSIFWTDIEKDTINRACWNGSNQQVLVNSNLISPAGLSLDWMTNKLYWTDAGTVRIEVANTDGSMRSLLIWDQLDKPRDIVVDPMEGYMYWSDWGEVPKIERAAMDGSMRKAIITQNITWPNGLAIDHTLGRIYWADGSTKVIEYANLDGTDRKILISSNMQHPFGLDVFGDYVYWTDWEAHSIQSANKNTGQEREILGVNITGLMDVRVFHRNRRNIKTPCSDSNGGCSHLCLIKPKGYSCACPIGITLEDDRKTCKSGPKNSLIFAHRIDIRQISLDVPYRVDVVLPLPPLRNAVAIDIDKRTNELYWSDTGDDIIQKASLDGKKMENIITDGLETADGIAVDSVGRKIYWTDGGRNSIEVSELNGHNRKVLIWADLDSPRAISVYYQIGMMYWSDWGVNARIEHAYMDGTNRKSLISENLGWPNGLAVDILSSRLYWNDGKLQLIESSDLDGNNRKTIITDVPHPYGLVVVEDHIYWTDWQTKALHRANKNSGEEKTIIRDNLEGLMSIKAIHNEQEIENVCGENNGGCSHLCLRNPNGFTCACPTGILMSTNDSKICKPQPDEYLLFATRTTLARISLDTPELWDVTLPISNVQNAMAIDFHWEKELIFYTDVEMDIIRTVNMYNLAEIKTIVYGNLTKTDGIAVDWIADNLYWTDTGTKLLEVAKIDGSCRKVLIRDGLDEPRSVAIYPKKGYLYWTDWGAAKIERAYLDGTSRKKIISTDLGFPNGLALDFDANRLYWTDALKDRIETSDLHGNNRVHLRRDDIHPFGLTQFENHIYWTDWLQTSVLRADKTTGQNNVTIRTLLDGIMEIKAVSAKKQTGHNPCANNNGGCTHLCLFTHNNYTCACPDVPDSKPCKTVPKSWLPVEPDEEVGITPPYSFTIHPLDEFDTPYEPEDEKLSDHFIIITLMVFLIILLGILAFILALLYHKRKVKCPYASRRSVMTFSNPNYYNSNNEVVAPTTGNKKPFSWKRLKYDKAQERVYEDKSTANGPEVASLIQAVLTSSSSNCEVIMSEMDHSSSMTPSGDNSMVCPGELIGETSCEQDFSAVLLL